MKRLARYTFTGCCCAKRANKPYNGASRENAMQNAKDSFYMALRTRQTIINPERTMVVRGTVRPGILAEDAEAPFSQPPTDVFVLRWSALGVDLDLSTA